MNESLFQFVNQFAGSNGYLDEAMTFFAEKLVWVMIGIMVVLWFTGKLENQRIAFNSVLTAMLALGIGMFVIGPMIDHPRPFVSLTVNQLVTHDADPSFPSDHSTFAFSLAFAALLVKRRIGILMLALASLIGIGRVFVGVHFPFDVLGGMALALICAFIVHILHRQTEPALKWCVRVYRKATFQRQA
ncbi:undecaprenyl-diphosphatase [Paenibacillus aquistagni]|uniref:Undecaprenyl-diphosphatase n=1 Tax=Paenibacillus aquistagni TaxID=1852522 RepID=A0A1X7IKG3_9BACL|nr:undecaprenyl-diphosphatase [Paenibacillus aquistagni]SMG15302.1 Undecaprenyl-diphosphatase [Paenibacillus aquistagni]